MDDHELDEELDAEVQAYTNNEEMSENQGQGDHKTDCMSMDELADYLRSNALSLMAQNVAPEVFDCEEQKDMFEDKFRHFCENNPDEVTFNYLKSFRRVRVNFPIGFDAICAKIELHQTEICGSVTNVYLA